MTRDRKKKTDRRPGAPPPAPPRAALLVAALLLALGGVALSVALARLHARAHAGLSSFCAINDVVNCDRVALSSFSTFLGLPVAIWGALGYGLAAMLAARALAHARRGLAAARGLLFAVAAVAVAASLALAVVSELAIGAWCLLCMASWVTAAALLATAWRACPSGPAAAVAADVAVLRARPARAAALALVAVVAVVGARAAYARYAATVPRAAAASAGQKAPGPVASPAPVTAGGVVVEFSDYECPFCARAHEQLATLRAARPDLEIVRRHFPLDAACNPALARSIHPSACALARAAICAEAQGRFAEMDDALFGNQQAREPVSRLAGRLGLDVAAFEACLASPATEARLARDVEDGMRAGVRATPSYVVAGKVYAGELPPGLLAAPAAPAPAPRAAER